MNRDRTTHLAILGLGLMGGSLGMAARACGMAVRITAYARREESRREALALGIADAVFPTPAEAVNGADMVVLCTPVLGMEALLRACGNAFSAGAVVTDVGSTKVELERSLTPLAQAAGADFVGSHPVCGSERAGLAAARADLYRGARVIVSTSGSASASARERVCGLWESVGARVIPLDAAAHDRMFAWTSHLPHMAAAALVAVTAEATAGGEAVFGSGFRDTTRIAQGSDAVWHDIVKSNAQEIAMALEGYERVLRDLRTMIADADYEGVRMFLAGAARERARWCEPESTERRSHEHR